MNKIEITNEFIIAQLNGIKSMEKYDSIDDLLLVVLREHIQREETKIIESVPPSPFGDYNTFDIYYSTQATNDKKN